MVLISRHIVQVETKCNAIASIVLYDEADELLLMTLE